mgnify:CR=1 FL=1
MFALYKKWLAMPSGFAKSLYVVIPIILSQVLQRLYPIIDNRYFAALGQEALYLHNIQYNFIALGQFIGLATYISCLIFWRREECLSRQGNILIKHLVLAGALTAFLGLGFWIYLPEIITGYQIDNAYLPLAEMYLKIGVCNMVLYAIYGGLDGMLVGSQQQKYSLYIAAFMVTACVIFNQYASYALFTGLQNTDALILPIISKGLSTTALLIGGIILAFILVKRRVEGWESLPIAQILSVWWSELGTYLIRGAVPFIYAYQLNFAVTTSRFLTTYQLALHISYIFCFPLIGAMQIAIRDASAQTQDNPSISTPPSWWSTFLYSGFIPTTALMALGASFSAPIINFIYGYEIPTDHLHFLTLFFISCWIGQIGNTLTIPLRAAKMSYLVTKNFFIAELVVMIGGTQLLIMMGNANIIALGIVSVLFTSAFCALNLRDVSRLRSDVAVRCVYEASH